MKTSWRIIRYACAIAATTAIAACNNANEIEPENRIIGFSIGMTDARAVELNNLNLDRIGVFAYSTNDLWEYAPSTQPDYFVNKMVVKMDNSDKWWYDGPTRYWPQDRFLTFFAYAPYIDVQDIFQIKTDGSGGSPTIRYTPPVEAIDQIDILWDALPDLQYESNGGHVRFHMNHALTSIEFEVAVADDLNHEDAPFTIQILEAGIRNAIADGAFDFGMREWTFEVTDPSHLTDYALKPDPHKGLNDITFHLQYDPDATPEYVDPAPGSVALNKPYATLMILPQEFRDNTTLFAGNPNPYPTTVYIKYRVTNLLSGETNDVTREIELWSHETAKNRTWGMGVGITYQFIISLFDNTVVKVKTREFIADEKWKMEDEDTITIP